jgi:glycoside/pentoside/hexuronide:cation symporter, GPH family
VRGLIAFPAGLPVEQMPIDKVNALAWFVLTLTLLAGSVMAWLVGTFRIDETKIAEVRGRVRRPGLA